MTATLTFNATITACVFDFSPTVADPYKEQSNSESTKVIANEAFYARMTT